MNRPGKKSERGNALLEFALGFFVIWAIFSGVYQIGYAFYVYNSLLAAVNDAAQLGSKLGYDTASPSAFTTAVTNMVVYGDQTAGSKSLVPNLTTSNVSVSVNPDAAGMPTNVEVKINSYAINALFTSYTLTNKPRVTTKYFGLISCSTC
ncbi:MAG: TadE family protein [Bryobacterales bacterium]|nr:TadE family protein [Bryobacterales bacterium]